MWGADNVDKVPPSAQDCLRDLTERFYNNLLAQLNDNELKIKPGEFVKMVELTVKLAPSKSEQKEFWEHIDKIRREHLTEPKKNTIRAKSKSVSTSKRKTAKND